MSDSQTKLLRLAAFLVDSIFASILLILPASLLSYAMAWIGGEMKAIQFVWLGAIFVLLLWMLFRDGYRGRSLGKQLLGLRLITPSGKPCGYGRSALRNVPLIIPFWNLIEAALVLVRNRRSGDQLAGTAVADE